jgi:hypothetical protein
MTSAVLTPAELAKRWGITARTLAEWRSLRKGPAHVRLGEGTRARIVYRLEDVVEYEMRKRV